MPAKVTSDDVSVLTAAKAEFEAKLHKLSEHLYKEAQAAQGQQQAQGGAQAGGEAKPKSDKDNVVDAEFE